VPILHYVIIQKISTELRIRNRLHDNFASVFFNIPFYLQSVQVHSANCVMERKLYDPMRRKSWN
jgi:hypothetical protein